jgi:phosphoribosylaminoimidazole-succinocarboxamide synthase
LARGKVRDNYAVGNDRILMVASDRISAFDVVMGEPIPGKGALLTQMALFWFDKLGHICPNHLTGDAPESVVSDAEKPFVAQRSMLVRRLKPIPVEAVVRGYLAGSGWKEYQESQSVCGVPLPAGLKNASRLPEPIFTPAAKAEMGEHDENISFADMVATVGAPLAERIREISLELYRRASDHAATRGIIIADTKFEFGLDEAGTLHLMDEVLTADSSRFWPADSYRVGISPPSFDKQYVRDYLETLSGWSKTPPPPPLPPEVIAATAAKYREALERFWPRIVSGGIVVCDDYEHLPGAKMACDDFAREHGLTILGRWTPQRAHLVKA